MVEIARFTRQELAKKYNEKDCELIITNFIYSTLICPLICYPEGFGVLDEGLIIPAFIRKTIVSISLIMENSIRMNMNQNSEDEYFEKFSQFLKNLISCENSYDSNRSLEINLLEIQQDFHRLISFNLNKIINQFNIFFKEVTFFDDGILDTDPS